MSYVFLGVMINVFFVVFLLCCVMIFFIVSGLFVWVFGFCVFFVLF